MVGSKLEVYEFQTGALKLAIDPATHNHAFVADDQDHGTFTVFTAQYHVHGKRLIISGANVVSVEGDGRIVVV